MNTTQHAPVSANKAGQTMVVSITTGNVKLSGELIVPPGASGLVIFAHSNGSNLRSPHMQFIAQGLRRHTFATLLIDLLAKEEDAYYRNRFDTNLLTGRLSAIIDWAMHNTLTRHLPIGYFATGAGAAAAVLASQGDAATAKAIVLRGGRVDLADEYIASLHVPTLFIVGQHDIGTRELNEEAFLQLTCTKKLAIVPGATHRFKEPAALDRAIQLASDWFALYLRIGG